MTGDSLTPKGRYGVYVPYALMLADFIVLNATLVLVLLLNTPAVPVDTLRVVVVLGNAAYLPVASMSFRIRQARAVHMERLVIKALHMVLLHAVIFFALIAFVGKAGEVPWHDYVEFYAIFIIVLPLSWTGTRLVLKAIRRHGRNYLNVVIVGYGDTASRLAEELQGDPGFGYMIRGFFSNEEPESFGRGRYLGNVTGDLAPYLAKNHVDEVYYAEDYVDDEVLKTVVNIADEYMASFFFVPRLSRQVARSFHLTRVGSLPVLAAMSNPLDNPVNRVVKRTFDIVFSSLFLIVSPVVFIPVAIAIKRSSPGPVFFKQKRTGYRGNEFTCWKFRTMRVNADADRSQATAHDPRKTRVGDFLRRSSIDELPQFINVLKGDMSVVGPRPHMIKHTEDYSRLINRYMVRHVVKPGITGWAQVLGFRGATNELWQMEGRVDKDVWYIENWSLALDLKIIVRTVTNALRGEENAY